MEVCQGAHQMSNYITIATSSEFVVRQKLPELFMVVYFSIHLN